MHACMLEERLVACVPLGLDKTAGVSPIFVNSKFMFFLCQRGHEPVSHV
jgi:hypothetical protein